jgi:hypothetical protein
MMATTVGAGSSLLRFATIFSKHLIQELNHTEISAKGLITLDVGLAGFALMPPPPTQSANWIRGKNGWFSERFAFLLRL